MNIVYKKYRLDHNLVKLLLELDFELEIHCRMKVNGILFNNDFHGDWKIFMKNKRKEKSCALFQSIWRIFKVCFTDFKKWKIMKKD